jgi:hypothetical protein
MGEKPKKPAATMKRSCSMTLSLAPSSSGSLSKSPSK